MDIVKRILRLMKPYRRLICLGLFLQLVVRVCHLIVPTITARVVNDVITAGVYDNLYPLCAALIGLAAE